MSIDLSPAEIGKFISAKQAMTEVQSGMTLGLGTGSTARWFVKLLAHEMRESSLKFQACSTSNETTELATKLGIQIDPLDMRAPLDLAVDGADEFDPKNDLIKGAGAALLIEKIVESNARRFVVITDASKEVSHLGSVFAIPVEVTKYGWLTTQKQIEHALGELSLPIETSWRGGQESPLVTDEGHYLLDVKTGPLPDARAFSDAMLNIAGVVETGLFLDMADCIIMGDAHGTARFREGAGEWQEKTYDLSSEAELIATLQAMDDE